MILDEIVANKNLEISIKDRETDISDFLELIDLAKKPKDFAKAVSKPVSLIAEVKKASPSAGVIKEDFDPVAIAKEYERSGASAVSVLTDEKYFGGSIKDLANVAQNVDIPVLRKDFIIDEYQIFEARAFGADAVLLIAAVLSDDQLDSFSDLTRQLEMSAVIEVHTKEELSRVADIFMSPAPSAARPLIIGINNRDLNTFNVDIGTTLDLIKLVPKIKSREDIRALKKAGVNAVLMGEELMRSHDIGETVKELVS
ncbi:MAG: indole-3-glycerol phosphate synthase TrpC [Candidatus Saganbacteria bacterium]|nr:indole-3-glycerol phosphate synthase TrpC [Candidatus Saganbacteria bacterium]